MKPLTEETVAKLKWPIRIIAFVITLAIIGLAFYLYNYFWEIF